jgi:PAS domain S-box-containing protein
MARKHHVRVADIIASAMDAIVAVDEEQRIIVFNPAAEKIFGHRAADVIGKSLELLIPERFRAQHREHIRRFDATSETGRRMGQLGEIVGLRTDGAEILLDAAITQTGSSPYKIFTAFLCDVSERRRAELAMLPREIRIEGVIASMAEGIVSIDETLCIVLFNPAAEQIFGRSREEMTGQPLSALIPERFRAQHEKHIRKFAATGQTNRAMGRYGLIYGLRASGEEFPIEATISQTGASPNKLLTVILRDITERMRVEVEREQLLGVLEASLNEIYIFDTDTLRFQYVNPSALRNLGYSADTVRVMTPLDLKQEFNAVSFRELVAPLLRGEQELRVFRTTHRRADRSLYPVEVHLQLVGRGDQRVFLAVIFDITERLRTEQALRDYAEQMRQLSRRLFETQENERRRLSRELHDSIGQNVTALTLSLNMVRSELPAEHLQKLGVHLNDCETLLYSTGQLVRDVMVELRPPGLDELGLLAALTEYARHLASISGFSAVVSGTEIMPRLPPETEITLFRIAQEALVNVAKHARATEAVVALKADPDRVVMTVSDNGRGFDAAERSPDAALHLGIVSMRERAEAIGGRLRVESVPGRGTRVTVEAPRAPPTSWPRRRLPGTAPA